MSFFAELKRRHVFRVAIMYIAAGWVLAEVAGFGADTFGAPAWVVQMFTILIALGFPLVLIGAWAFDMTPQGLKRDTATDEPSTDTEEQTPVMAASVVTEPVEESPSAQSIAVLPFVDMSPDKDQEYMSDGLSEELLNLLTKIPELRVAARTSSFSYKNKDVKVAQIGDELNVACILEGSVRKSGNQIRITTQLIQAEDGYHLWSETFDRALDDIFAIQDEIAAEVVAQLKLKLLGAAPVAMETDPEAYSLYLQARHLARQGTAKAFEQSIALYKQALAISPDYIAAWDGLAVVYIDQTDRGERPADEGYALAREAADKTLEIDPRYAKGYVRLALIADGYDRDATSAARHLEHALKLDATDLDTLGDAASLAMTLGHLDEAIALQEYALVRDPVNVKNHRRLGYSFLSAGRLDDAISSFRTALTLSPDMLGAQQLLGIALLIRGEPKTALAEIQKESDVGWRCIGLAMAHHALGQAAESDAALAKSIEVSGQTAANNIAFVLAFRGEADRAFEWLNLAVKYNDPGLTQIANAPMFSNIHSDPRWLPFLESIGKSPEQLAAIEFKVTLPE
jgi:TolB-like protein/Flp pilus assembly protein TadD